MLRWSAEATGRHVDIMSVRDVDTDPGLNGGISLVQLGRTAARITQPDPEAAERVAGELGSRAAVDAAAVAAAFEGLNRLVDATGLPIGRGARRDQADIIESLGLDSFPHAGHGA